MVFKIGTLLEKGRFNWKGVNKILHNHENRLDALEKGEGSSSSYDDTKIKGDISALEVRVKALEDAPYDDTEIKGDISALEARVEALEDAQTPGGG